MDPRASHTLFSRGSTPPPSNVAPHDNQSEEGPPPPPAPSHRAESQEVPHHQPQPSAVHDIEALLRGLNPQPSSTTSSNIPLPDSSLTTQTTTSESATDKQNALLHNLMNPSSNFSSQSQSDPMHDPSPQNSSSEVTGKQLLEQLITGQAESRSVYHPYNSQPSDISQSPYASSDTLSNPQWPSLAQTQPTPPSPTRKSIFDFVSPFDVLAAAPPPTSGPSASRKKPVPPMIPQGSSSNEDSSISVEERRNRDPKRQSVENLLSEATKGLPPVSSPPQLPPMNQEPYVPTESYVPVPPPQMEQRPKPSGPRNESPRGSPKARQRAAPTMESSAASPNMGSSRPREGSPTPRKRGGVKKISPPSTPSRIIIFDVSKPLDTIHAPNSVKSTAIALVKIEPVFLPGSTIGATSWIAYAMTKGRVRVISRSSGDRTLLQLPGWFPQNSSVIDMVVSGNRLAGVTSDGGFVVWELPTIIEDDVPARLVMSVKPTQGPGGLKSVKWHPKQADTLAVASENRIHLINVEEISRMYQNEPISQSDFLTIGQSFHVASSIVGFAFDVPHVAIATISEDSMLTLWNIRDRLPFWSHRILGEGLPSSIDFLDGGIVIGRKNGTIFQLLSVMKPDVLSTVKFVNGDREDPDMFGHVAYDSRIQTLWVANSRRESLIAMRVGFERATPLPNGEEVMRGGFEQIVEFSGPKASIHFVILTPDTDPNGEEAHAACVAAKLPPGELALVAFVVHSTGVDQVLIRKEWFQAALSNAQDRLPPYNGQHSVNVPLPGRQQEQPSTVGIYRRPTPLSDAEVEAPKEDVAQPKGRSNKPKAAPGYKDTEREPAKEKDKEREKDKGKEPEKAKPIDLGPLNDSPAAASLAKEIRKVEENLHTRIGRLIAKELDKQHHRLEEIRETEQRNEFDRQQTILKLISTELTKNTTRVVESAVKNEVQQSVLPALEKITKDEVKMAVNSQISKGLTDSMNQTLPLEVERLIGRPDVANHIARSFSAAITPLVEKHVKEVITNTLIPAYNQISSTMHQELSREIHSEILSLKKEIITWQSDALRGQEPLIRSMEHSIRTLSDQVKLLSLNMPVGAVAHVQPRGTSSPTSSAGAGSHGLGPLPSHLRQAHPAIASQVPAYAPPAGYAQPPPTQAQNWYSGSIPSQATPPSNTSSVNLPPPSKSEDYEEHFMTVLGSQDLRQLRELLARSSPEVILPATGKSPLSQAIILTLIHRLSSIVSDATPGEETYKSSLWWLQRAATALNPNDGLISPYIARLLPNIQNTLTLARQRALLPGSSGQQYPDASRMVHDIQEILNRKPLPSH